MKRRSNGESVESSATLIDDDEEDEVDDGERSLENNGPKLKKVKLDVSFSTLGVNIICHIMEYYSYFMEHTYILRDANRRLLLDVYAIKKLNGQREMFLLFPSIELEIYEFGFDFKYSFPMDVKHLKLIDRRPISQTENIAQSILYPIHKMPRLETFEIFSNILHEGFIPTLSTAKNLKSLSLKSAYMISLDGLKTVLQSCTSIQCLRLGYKGLELVDQHFCEHIIEHPNLKELHLPYHNISSKGLEDLITNSKLQILNLSENQEIEEADLSCLSKNDKLTDLNLSYNKLGGKQIKQIAKYGKNVKYLNLSTLKTEISPKNIGKLLQMNLVNLSIRHLKPVILDSTIFNIKSNLSKLDVSLTCGDENTLGDDIAIKISQNFTNLNFLSMRRCYITDKSAMELVKMPSLKHLNLSFNRITDETLRQFVQVNTSIETLFVNNNSQLTATGYKLLAYHPNLSCLRMSGKIGNDSIIHLLNNSHQLKFLQIEDYKRLSNLPFEFLEKCKTLEQLYISGCFVSDEAANNIAKSGIYDLAIINPKRGYITNSLLKILAQSKTLQTIRLAYDNVCELTEGVKDLKCCGKQVVWQ